MEIVRVNKAKTIKGHPFHAIGERLIVELIPGDAKIGMIHVPETARDSVAKATRVTRGRVVSIGPVRKGRDHVPVSLGDTVSFHRWHGELFECDGGKYCTVKFDELTMVEPPKKAKPAKKDKQRA